jgi:hypothetical protein
MNGSGMSTPSSDTLMKVAPLPDPTRVNEAEPAAIDAGRVGASVQLASSPHITTMTIDVRIRTSSRSDEHFLAGQVGDAFE